MKTIYVTFDKTVSCNLPVSVPDHWEHEAIMKNLHRQLIFRKELEGILEDLDWDMDADPTVIYQVAGFMDRYEWAEEPPVYAFPDEPAPAHMDQLDLLEAAGRTSPKPRTSATKPAASATAKPPRPKPWCGCIAARN